MIARTITTYQGWHGKRFKLLCPLPPDLEISMMLWTPALRVRWGCRVPGPMTRRLVAWIQDRRIRFHFGWIRLVGMKRIYLLFSQEDSHDDLQRGLQFIRGVCSVADLHLHPDRQCLEYINL